MTTYYYVYRVGFTKPTVKHQTLLSAANEAERLSNQHPGETFEILQCLAVTRTVLAKTFWMDGVTPPANSQESSEESDLEGWTDIHGGPPEGAYWRGVNPKTGRVETLPDLILWKWLRKKS